MCKDGKCDFTLPERFYGTVHGWTAVDESRDDVSRIGILYDLLQRYMSPTACYEECIKELSRYGFEEDKHGFSPLGDMSHWFWEDPELSQFVIDKIVETINNHIPEDCGYFGLHWNGGCIGFWQPHEEDDL